MTTLTPIATDRLAGYLRGAREREAARQAALADRHAAAWAAARAVAAVLREQFGATRIVVFGSLVDGVFDERSDIDMVVADVEPALFFRAWAVADRVARGFELDLVPLEDARPWLPGVLAASGVEL
jgi:uncharacterized protein